MTQRGNLASPPGTRDFLPSLTAGLVNGILIIIFQSAYAALIFSGPLADFLPNGMGIMLFGAFVLGTTVSLISSFPATVTAPQDAPAAIIAVIAAAVAASLSTAGHREAIFPTVVVAIALTTLFTGLFLLMLGWFRLGNLIRFIPYPVVGGFLAGTGWVLVRGAIRIMGEVSPGWRTLPELFHPEVAGKWLPGAVFAMILFVGMRRIRHYLLMPALILIAILLFYVALWLSGITPAEAGLQGWLFSGLSEGVSWQLLTPTLVGQVAWGEILAQAGDLTSIMLISVISLLLNASGLELIARQEIDLNREMRAAGLGNLLAGLGGSSVGYLSLSLTALGYRIGARRRIAGLLSAGMCALTLFLGVGIASYFPKPLLGGLLLYLGLVFLFEWLYKAWFTLPRAEYFLVVLILITIGQLGFLPGTVLGILIAVIVFVLNYSRIDVVKYALSGKVFQSNVERAPLYQRRLQEQGDLSYMLQLQGYLFFGTTNNVLDQVKLRMNASHLPPLRYLLLDFRLVTGVDSSAMNSFEKMKMLAHSRDIQLIFTGMKPIIERKFTGSGVLGGGGAAIKIFPDMDHGVEWIENQILAADRATVPQTESAGTDEQFMENILAITPEANAEILAWTAARLTTYLERKSFVEGEYLIRPGDEPVGIYIIESGQITAQLEPPDGRIIRLRKMGAGTVIGELSVYLGLPATAAVIANQTCQTLLLTPAKLSQMEQRDPQIAATFHKFIARVLGQRLNNSNKTLQALMR